MGHSPGSRNVTRQEIITFLSQVTASAFLNQSTECSDVVESKQEMVIDCLPLAGVPNGQFYEDQAPCVNCVNAAFANVSTVWEQERNQWRQGHAIKVRTPYEAQIEALESDLSGCKISCKACSFQDVSQTSVVTVDTTCQLSTQSQENWQSEVKARVTNELYSRRDILGALAEAVGFSSEDKTVVDFSSRVSSNCTQTVATTILSNVNVNQSIRFVSRGEGATLFTGASQNQFLTQGTQALVNSDFSGNLLSEDEWRTLANIYQDRTTLNEIGDVLLKTVTSFTDIINTTIGGVMFALIILASVLIVAVIILASIRAAKAKESQQGSPV